MTIELIARAGAEDHRISKPSDRVAVIDVGSNSVRLVVYHALGRAPVPVFNEKVLCGLGRRLRDTGRLEPTAVDLALATLARFATLARAMAVASIDTVATAAVREAEDGKAFVARATESCGIDIRVLSGAEEARLSALGVLAATPGAQGLMGDLGGGSLELVRLDGRGLDEAATLPVGPLRFLSSPTAQTAVPIIDAELDKVPWLADVAGQDLYVVGGTWRAIGHIQMRLHNYPLHVLHGYAVPADDMHDVAMTVAGLGERSLNRISGISRERLAHLPIGARTLAQLIERSGARRVVFSAYGLREGLLLDRLSEAERQGDPLLAACRDYAGSGARFPAHGDMLTNWIDSLFRDETAAEKRLRDAAAHLSDIGWRAHPDHRPQKAFFDIAQAPFVGIDHNERIRLALMIHARYTGRTVDEATAPLRALITDEDDEHARRIGQVLRLAHTISGGVAALLRDVDIYAREGQLVLETTAESRHLIGHVVQKRLQALAETMILKPEVKIKSGGTTDKSAD